MVIFDPRVEKLHILIFASEDFSTYARLLKFLNRQKFLK